MPLYEYLCDDCGLFNAWRPMADSSLPVPCETCGAESIRILSASSVARGGGGRLSGGPEPRLVQRKEREPEKASAHAGHDHGASARPWMIGH